MRLKNIILIGIMGCGKTTLGRLLAQELHMDFLDLDAYIESRWGSISELFTHGEEHFRDLESRAVTEVCNRDACVIATGGGIIKREKNIQLLKQKGLVFFVDRPLENILTDIDTSERPLLKEGKEKLSAIFHERYPIYLNTCNVHIKNTKPINEVVTAIIHSWQKATGDD